MNIKIKDEGCKDGLSKLQAHLDFSKLSRTIGDIAWGGVLRNFAAGGRSKDGSPGAWPGLKESTLLMRRSGKGTGSARPLRDKGLLMNGIHPEYGGNTITLATAGQPQDAIMHFGGVTHPRVTMKMIWFMWHTWQRTRFEMFANIASKARGSKLTVNIPARPYLMLTDPDIAEIRDAVLNFPGANNGG